MEGLRDAFVEWWATTRTLPGQTDSGDRHLVHEVRTGVLLAVVDGIGHGREAASAAEIAVETLQLHAQEPLVALVKHCHEALRQTRGAVMSLAHYQAREGMVTWLGVGNIEGLVLRAGSSRGPVRARLLQRSGVVGKSLPSLHASTFPVHVGDTLLFATDGIATDFDRDLDPGQRPEALAERILSSYGRSTDDALVLVARFMGVRS